MNLGRGSESTLRQRSGISREGREEDHPTGPCALTERQVRPDRYWGRGESVVGADVAPAHPQVSRGGCWARVRAQALGQVGPGPKPASTARSCREAPGSRLPARSGTFLASVSGGRHLLPQGLRRGLRCIIYTSFSLSGRPGAGAGGMWKELFQQLGGCVLLPEANAGCTANHTRISRRKEMRSPKTWTLFAIINQFQVGRRRVGCCWSTDC